MRIHIDMLHWWQTIFGQRPLRQGLARLMRLGPLGLHLSMANAERGQHIEVASEDKMHHCADPPISHPSSQNLCAVDKQIGAADVAGHIGCQKQYGLAISSG